MTDFERGIDALYAALEDPNEFSQSLKALQTSVGVEVTAFHILIVDPISLLPVGGMSPEAPEGHEVYENQFAVIDPRLKFFNNDSDTAFNLNAVFNEPEHKFSPVYHEFLSEFDGQIGAAVVKRINSSANLVFAGFRSGKSEYFDRNELARIECLARNIGRITSFRGTYSTGGTEDTAILMNWAKQVVEFTPKAEEEMKRLDATLKLSYGQLWACEKKSNQNLQDAIDAVLSKEVNISRDIIIHNLFGKPEYIATVQAILSTAVLDKLLCAPKVVIKFDKIDPKLTVSETLIGELFGLSRTEAEITNLLCQGLSPKSIATKRNVAISTVRWTIRNLLEKFEVSSQTELVAAVTRIPGVLR